MRAGIEPGETAPEYLDIEVAALKIGVVDVRDLDLAAWGRLDAGCDLDDVVVIKLEPGDGYVGLRLFRLFLDGARAAGVVEFDHPVLFGGVDDIAKHRGAMVAGRRRR